MKARFISCLLFLMLMFSGCDAGKKTKNVWGSVKHFISTALVMDETSATCPSHINYYNYTGFRDWYRFPLEYPYHIIMRDTLETGSLEKFDGGDIRNPNESSEPVVGGIEAIIPLKTCLIFRLAKTADSFLYGVFFYADGKRLSFDREEEMQRFFLQKAISVNWNYVTLGDTYYKFQKKK